MDLSDLTTGDAWSGTVIGFQIAPRFQPASLGVMWPWPGADLNLPVDVLLRIRDNDGNVMVDVLPTGRVILTEHYDLDDVARRFWGGLFYLAQELLHRRDE